MLHLFKPISLTLTISIRYSLVYTIERYEENMRYEYDGFQAKPCRRFTFPINQLRMGKFVFRYRTRLRVALKLIRRLRRDFDSNLLMDLKGRRAFQSWHFKQCRYDDEREAEAKAFFHSYEVLNLICKLKDEAQATQELDELEKLLEIIKRKYNL